jgi:hypothetical protein
MAHFAQDSMTGGYRGDQRPNSCRVLRRPTPRFTATGFFESNIDISPEGHVNDGRTRVRCACAAAGTPQQPPVGWSNPGGILTPEYTLIAASRLTLQPPRRAAVVSLGWRHSPNTATPEG